MMRLFSLILMAACLLGGVTPTDPGMEQSLRAEEPEAFLTDVFTVESQMEEVPMDQRAAYLEERFGAYCEDSALEAMLSARFPFSLMEEAAEEGVSIRVLEVETKAHEPVNEEAGIKLTYRVTALREEASGNGREMDFTGRLTLNPDTGRVQSVRFDHLNKTDG